ncbi:MAG: ATP synthase F0 subunit B [Pseudomonadota bacterium]
MQYLSDSALLLANIVILLLLFVKFAAKPLIDFLKGHKKKLSEELENLKIQKETLISEIKEINKNINENQSGLKASRENLLQEAEQKLFETIKEAKHESDLILDKAKQETENRILHETQKLYSEIRSEILPKTENEKKTPDE